ncbi:MAG: hypothetical protein IKP27_00240 [Paludibacteraceae bacterium]|nr:hypothetical protein [Paludibacteraceae bacterium]
MKKLFLAVAALLSAMAVDAQAVSDSTNESNSTPQMVFSNAYKPEEGSFMMEIGFAPFHTMKSDSANGGLINLQGGLLRGVYVLTENLELKLGLGVSIFKDVDDNGAADEEWHKITDRTALFSVCPGINYVFDGTDKLAPYVGGELEFGITSTKHTEETEEMKQVRKNQGGFNTFGVAAVSGFNFYFAKNIFIGAEVKFGVEMQVDKKPSEETDGKTTIMETKSHDLIFEPQAVPTLRLGWAF